MFLDSFLFFDVSRKILHSTTHIHRFHSLYCHYIVIQSLIFIKKTVDIKVNRKMLKSANIDDTVSFFLQCIKEKIHFLSASSDSWLYKFYDDYNKL